MSFLRLTMLRGARRSVLSRHVLTERRLSSASVASSSASAESTTLRRLGAALFSGLCGTTACLCGWQVKRYGDKVQMVEDRKTALQAAPRPLREVYPELSAGISAGDEYTRVSVEGTFDHARQVLLGPRSAPPGSDKGNSPAGAPAQSGWDVVTPLACADGSRVLVNRGWVPRDATAVIDQPTGQQRIEGVLKQGDRENKYGHNDPAAGRYVWLDLASLARSSGSSPILVMAAAEGSDASDGRAASSVHRTWPRVRPLSSLMSFYVEPHTHIVYAATWASLTVAGAVITVKRFVR
jgi:surfeit locus 1 family protein